LLVRSHDAKPSSGMYRRQTGSNSVTSCLSVIQAQSQRVTRRNTPRFADYAAELNLATFPLPETAEKGKPVYNARYLVDENARSELEALFAMMKRNAIRLFLAATAAVLAFAFHARGGGQTTTPDSRSPQPPGSLRLYVMDCGTLHIADMERFQLKKEEVSTTNLSVACFLVVHPKGTLLWDAGAVPDATWKPTGSPTTQHVVLPDSQERDVTMLKSLTAQLAEVGYSPSDITYLGLSHYHYDHTANANEFTRATWLVRQVEREAMFAEKPPGTTQPSTYSALHNSKTLILKSDEHDVFGDGTVVIKSAPGHTPGHQVLYIKLAKTGGVVLSGDLYHYPEERALDRVPTFEFSQEQARATRVAIDAFLKKSGAQLWIQHDFNGNAKLKKSPNFYD